MYTLIYTIFLLILLMSTQKRAIASEHWVVNNFSKSCLVRIYDYDYSMAHIIYLILYIHIYICMYICRVHLFTFDGILLR